MVNNIKLSEIMSTSPVTIHPSDTMEVVDKYFRQNSFHHLPVVDDQNRVVGIISKSDYLALRDVRSYFLKHTDTGLNQKFFQSLLVREVMTRPVATLKYDARISNALGMIRENLFHAIPIVNDHDKLVGIVTIMDLVSHAYREMV